jgi:hypothetical protein
MVSDIKEILQSLLKDTSKFAGDELKSLVEEAKDDVNPFIKRIGDVTEFNLKLRAQHKITDDELVELMENVLDLNKMEFHKLANDTQVKAQRIVNGLSDLVTNKLLTLL